MLCAHLNVFVSVFVADLSNFNVVLIVAYILRLSRLLFKMSWTSRNMPSVSPFMLYAGTPDWATASNAHFNEFKVWLFSKASVDEINSLSTTYVHAAQTRASTANERRRLQCEAWAAIDSRIEQIYCQPITDRTRLL